MKNQRVTLLAGMILATSTVGAREISCGPCPDTTTFTVAVLPPADGDAGAMTDVDLAHLTVSQCEALCNAPIATCVALPLPLDGGGSLPAVECTVKNTCCRNNMHICAD